MWLLHAAIIANKQMIAITRFFELIMKSLNLNFDMA